MKGKPKTRNHSEAGESVSIRVKPRVRSRLRKVQKKSKEPVTYSDIIERDRDIVEAGELRQP